MWKKRLLSILLALSCLLALMPALPVTVQAAPETGSGSIPFQVNPLYQSLVDPEVFEDSSSEIPVAFLDDIDYVDMATAGAQLRQAMVARADYCTLYYTTQNDDVGSTLYEVNDFALAHTGNPEEGDYLLFTYGGWRANYRYRYADDVIYVEASFELRYYTTEQQEADMDVYVESLLDQLNLYNCSDYQKVKGIYDYITKTVRYDYEHLYDSSYLLQYTAYAALVNKTAVCQGYANLFYRLALELGVDARIISGDSNGPHAWNITELDSLWYNVDATWDEGASRYDWFLLSPGSFVDHYRNSQYETNAFHKKYPMAAQDYAYDSAKSNIQIDTEPKNTTVSEGAVAKVSVKARGKGLQYQWYTKDPGQERYYKSSNQTDTYSVKMTAEKSGRLVYCMVTDAYGNKLKSKTVVLKAAAPVKITQQPKGMAVCEGKTAKATVTASGDGLKYQWYIKDPGKSEYSKSSLTGNTYSVKMTPAKSGRRVLCKITDKYGNTVKTTSVVLSRIDITKQPAGVSAANGAVAKVSVQAEGSGLSYQWYIKNPGGSKFSKSSVTGSTYSCKMSDAISGRQVYCVVKDTYGNSVTTKTVTLSQITITKQPQNAAAAEGDVIKVSVKAEGKDLSYQWYIKNPGGSKFSKSSVTGSTYSCKMSDAVSGRQVYCVITDGYNNTVKPKTVTLSAK